MVADKVIESCHDTLGITINGQYCWLAHYPHISWDQSARGSWHAYGHVHNRLLGKENGLSTDTGVDAWNFFPVSFEQFAAKISKIKEKLDAQERVIL